MTPPKATPSPTEPETPEAAKPLFSLGQLHPDRQHVTIGEGAEMKSYPMREIGDFGLADQHAIEHASREFEALWEKNPAQMNDEECARMDALLEKLTKWAIDAPLAAIKRVTPSERKTVIQLFTLAQRQLLQQAVTQAMGQILEQEIKARREP